MNEPNIVQVQNVLGHWLTEQPWYKRYANTVSTVVGGLVILAWWVTATWIDAPTWVATVVGAVLFVAAVVGVWRTPNGMTPKTVAATVRRLRFEVPPPSLDELAG